MTDPVELSSTKHRETRPIIPFGFILACTVIPLTTGTDKFFWICITVCPIMYFAQFFWNQDLWVEGDTIKIRGLFRKEFIQIDDIEIVNLPADPGGIATFYLKKKTKFGRKIKFYTKTKSRFFRSRIMDPKTETALTYILNRVKNAT